MKVREVKEVIGNVGMQIRLVKDDINKKYVK